MFPASRRQAFQLLLAMIAVSLTVAMTAPREEEEPLKYCQKAIRNCRLKTNWEDLDGQRFVNLNISCFCESDEPEDVWEALEEVSHHKCTAVPMNDDYKVNHSSVHITGCNIAKEVFPLAVMQLARRSDHLEFVLNQCPYVRFEMLTKEQRRVPQLSVSFKDSKLSGLPRGWLVNAEKMDVQIEGCDIAIVDSKAISGFTDGDDVSIEIRNTNISTVKTLAFQFPPLGTLTIKDSRVTTWSKFGYEGGSEVILSGVTFARVLVDGFNLHGVKSFNMTDCNVAELSAEAITDNDRQGPSSKVDSRKATIKHNIFIGANGEAFVNLCKFDSISWGNNTFLNLSDAPPRLQSDKCETKRNWKETVVVTGLNCMECEDFAVVNEQSCAFYRTGFCTSCLETNDNCNSLVMPYVTEKCKNSHPEVTKGLFQVCEYDPDALVPSARSLNDDKAHWNAAQLQTAPSFIVIIAMFVACLTTKLC
ncbi:uncharacterized protein [Palaemon carinicauda]|uniref:uncharacterized protein n=1 Tax=Palaemon carinicauda TaxID=392227 RepID=UPI0035B62708